MTTYTLLALFLLLVAGLLVGVLVRNSLERNTGTGLVLLTGLFLLYLGEWFGDGTSRLVLSVAGLLVALGSVGLRYHVMSRALDDARRDGHQRALIWMSVAAGSLLLYGLSLDPVVDALGFSDETARDRWVGVWWSLFPIATLVGLVPTLMIDRLLNLHPVAMPAGAIQNVQLTGVASALAIALMFPVNYLGSQSDAEWDVAYFRTTAVGESTRAIAASLADPVEVVLFYPAGSEVAAELEPYFTDLEQAAEGRMTVRIVDQAMDPVLAEELKIRDNGTIVLRQGEVTESFRINKELDRAKRELKKLDATVQEHLTKLTRGQRQVYLLAGHGEATHREKDDPVRKINLYKREVLEGLLSMKVDTFGVTEGSTDAVPDDADLVIVAGPTEPLLDEEVEVLQRYWDRGGSLLIMVDPEGDPLTELLAHVGVEPGEAVLAHATAHVRLTGGPADRVYLATRKYGSHAAVKQLSRNSAAFPMVLPTARSIGKAEGTDNRVTTLIRTESGAWEDTNRNYEKDDDERSAVYELAAAVTRDLGKDDGADDDTEDDAASTEPTEARAIVVGDVAYLSDPVLQRMQGNAVFAVDSLKWLTFDEATTGRVESEEDVKILHTREEDWLWFVATVVAVPGLVLLAGVLFIRMRQRSN